MLAIVIPCTRHPERDVTSYSGGDFEDVGNFCFGLVFSIFLTGC